MSLKTEPRPLADEAAFLDAQQFAAMLGVSIRTVWRLVAAGQIPQPTRFNRKLVRWNRAAVEDWIDEHR